jgi:putative protease
VKLLEKLGFKRVVLARELGMEEIKHIAQNSCMEVEIFIHGALCVCYSGQCLMSSIIGGRSGNRGKCAQPCRMPYRLVGKDEIEIKNKIKDRDKAEVIEKVEVKVKGKDYRGWDREALHIADSEKDGRNYGYLLSPKDLCLLGELPAVLDSGVKSLKIEGRMKSPEYVATVVRIYRKYIDKALNGDHRLSPGDFRVDEKDLKDLTQIFNRGGFTRGYFGGKTGSSMMSYEKPKNWGIILGEVLSSDSGAGTVKIKLAEELSTGDGVEIWNGMGENPGNIVTEIKVDGRNASAASQGDIAVIGRINGRIFKGNKVYKTSDKGLNTEARKSFSGRSARKSGVKARLVIHDGEEVYINVRDNKGNEALESSGLIPEKAVNRPIEKERILAQLNKTGDTPFKFDEITIDLGDNLSVPVSEINNLRRKVLDGLEKVKISRYKRSTPVDFLENARSLLYFQGSSKNIEHAAENANKQTKLTAFFYSQNGAVDFARLNIDRLYLPFSFFLDKRRLTDLEQVRERGCEVFLWLPSITRGNYDRLIESRLYDIARWGLDGLLIGNASHIRLASELPGLKVFADHTLNLFNSFSMKEIAELNLKGATLSLELTLEQMNRIRYIPAIEAEAVVYGRLPVMTSEYCPAGSMAGGFNDSSKCSGVCGRKAFTLKDRKGMEFPVLCDKIDCRSVILNSNVLFNIDDITRIGRSGVHSLRLVFTDEDPEDITSIVDMHREAIKNGGSDIKKYAYLIERIKSRGFTKGHYFRGV